MARVISRTRAMCSPGKYIQGRGELGNLPGFLSGLGDRALILIDPLLYEGFRDRLEQIFESYDLSLVFVKFNGEISKNEIQRVGDVGERENCPSQPS